jgi:hypothetical protein
MDAYYLAADTIAVRISVFPYFRLTDRGFQACLSIFALWAVMRGLMKYGKKYRKAFFVKKEPSY